ncbi:MAG: YbaB/EbfC family nucleoid-associated protein [Cyanobacteria bacterium P01_H01_bin.121]
MAGKGFGFSLGKMKELTEAFKKAQQVQEGAKQLQEELEQMEIEGQAGGGLVKVYMSGNQEPLRTEISPDLMSEGPDVLADLVTAAMKDAYKQSTETMRARMESLTSGSNLPGM